MKNIFINTDNSNIPKGTILVISDDLVFINNMSEFDKSKYEISFFIKSDFFLLKEILNRVDVIVFDNTLKNLEDFVKIHKLIQSYDLNVPIFVLEDEMPDDLSIYKCSNAYSIFLKNRSIKELFLSIDLCIYYLSANKKAQFEDGFSFDVSKETLFHNKKIVKLTAIERKLLKLLVENINNLVSYEEIENKVWKGKKFSIYTLRNAIKHIREKTHDRFIQNSSNRGYKIRSL